MRRCVRRQLHTLDLLHFIGLLRGSMAADMQLPQLETSVPRDDDCILFGYDSQRLHSAESKFLVSR